MAINNPYGSGYNPDARAASPGAVVTAPESPYTDPRYTSISGQIDALQGQIDGWQKEMAGLRAQLASPPATNANGDKWYAPTDNQTINAQITALRDQITAAGQNLATYTRQRNDFLDSWDKQHPPAKAGAEGPAPESEAALAERTSRQQENEAQARSADAQARYHDAMTKHAGDANNPEVQAAKIAADNAQATASYASAAHSNALASATAAKAAQDAAAAPGERALTAAKTTTEAAQQKSYEASAAANNAQAAKTAQEMQQGAAGDLATKMSQWHAMIASGDLTQAQANDLLANALGYGTPAQRDQATFDRSLAVTKQAADAHMLVPSGYTSIDPTGALSGALKKVGIDYHAQASPTLSVPAYAQAVGMSLQPPAMPQGGGFGAGGPSPMAQGVAAPPVGTRMSPQQLQASPYLAGQRVIGGPLDLSGGGPQVVAPAPAAPPPTMGQGR